MADNLKGYTSEEVLNKVLNTSSDSLKVDVVSGAEYAEDSGHTSADTGNFILGVRNDTLAALGGTDGDYVPFQMNSSGALYVEAAVESGQIKSGAIASGALASGSVVDGAMVTLGAKADAKSSATDTTSITAMQVLKQISASVQETAADTGTMDSDTDAIKTAVELIDNVVHVDDAGFTLGTHSGVMMMGFAGTQSVNADDAGAIAMETDGSIHIHDGGNTITVDGTVTANLSATDNAVLDAIDTVLDTIKTDTQLIETATIATQAAVEKNLYGTGLVINAIHGGTGGTGDQTLGATYQSLYVGVGGNVVVTLATSGSDFTFVNVASGQLLPVQITHVKQTGTTATNMIALKG